jgi:antitoxin VapB
MQTAKIFTNGRSQAVRLPKEFRFSGREVIIRRLGNAVVLLPASGSWEMLKEGLDRFTADFPARRNQPRQQKREAL